MKRVLTINGGSSSIKFAWFDEVEPPARSLSGEIERIGVAGTVISAQSANATLARNEPFEAADLEQAGERLIGWLGKHIDLGAVEAVGHRVVHGGPRHSRSQRITRTLVEELQRLGPLDPDHLPGEIA